jgi:hypothetical protein
VDFQGSAERTVGNLRDVSRSNIFDILMLAYGLLFIEYPLSQVPLVVIGHHVLQGVLLVTLPLIFSTLIGINACEFHFNAF